MDGALSISVVALAGFVLPLLASRLRLPAVVLEILFGIAIGPSILGWIHATPEMAFLAELGFLLLMFLSGFEIDFNELRRQGGSQIGIGLLVFVLTLFFAYKGARLLGHGPFVTLLLATTSVGLVVPTLREGRHTATALGQTILIAAILSDFLTLIGTTLLAMVHENGLGWNLLRFPALFATMAVLLLSLRRLAWWFPDRFERLFSEEDNSEIGIRASLALMFVFVGLSHMLGVESILGAFLAGTAFAMIFRHRGALDRKLSGFSYGFFIPIFFIHVGLEFDLQALMTPGVFRGALSLIGVAIAVKLLASCALFLKGLSPREVLAAGILLSARLSLVIAVAKLGSRLNLLDPALETQVVLLAVVTATLTPTLFGLIAPRKASCES
ncbi:MAG: cation:proton antiporter [Acidobacteriota bacterium]|nr:cation:proton antiporter [Acidobacteriota bacterium]MDH3786130.1 cation:proton antiporter [Acidobacteriota bacterium]